MLINQPISAKTRQISQGQADNENIIQSPSKIRRIDNETKNDIQAPNMTAIFNLNMQNKIETTN